MTGPSTTTGTVRMRLRPGSSRDVATFTRLSNAQSQWLRGEDSWQEDELAAILISATGEPADNDRYLEVGGRDGRRCCTCT